MIDISAFLEKVKRDINGAKETWITYDGVEFQSIRQTSKKTLSVTENELVGVYNAQSKDTDIIDDCLEHIEQHEKKQAEQSRRFNQAMGMVS